MIQSNSQATKVLDTAAGVIVEALSMHISVDSSFSRAIAFLAADFALSSSISFVKSSCSTESISPLSWILRGRRDTRTARLSKSAFSKMEYGAGGLGGCLSPI